MHFQYQNSCSWELGGIHLRIKRLFQQFRFISGSFATISGYFVIILGRCAAHFATISQVFRECIPRRLKCTLLRDFADAALTARRGIAGAWPGRLPVISRAASHPASAAGPLCRITRSRTHTHTCVCVVFSTGCVYAGLSQPRTGQCAHTCRVDKKIKKLPE